MILVVRSPAGSMEDLTKIRDYVVESLGVGVLVLPADMSYKLEQMPLAGVQIEHSEENDIVPKITAAEEKRMILKNLKAYRERHGLGSYAALVNEFGGGGRIFTVETLRGVADGSLKLPIEDWRAIGTALNKAVAADE